MQERNRENKGFYVFGVNKELTFKIGGECKGESREGEKPAIFKGKYRRVIYGFMDQVRECLTDLREVWKHLR